MYRCNRFDSELAVILPNSDERQTYPRNQRIRIRGFTERARPFHQGFAFFSLERQPPLQVLIEKRQCSRPGDLIVVNGCAVVLFNLHSVHWVTSTPCFRATK